MSRRKAREAALQALFQMDFNETDGKDALDAVWEEVGTASVSAREYAASVVHGTRENLERIDAMIGECSSEWKVSRMPGVDRNIARLAVYELFYGEEKLVPSIAINEAVELAKLFGTDASARFVNGILGAMVKKNSKQPE